MTEFLHERRDFGQLIVIVAEQRGIEPTLVHISAAEIQIHCMEKA